MPLDTDGCTQDNCCLLFMEGPSATLHALFIWRLLKGYGQEPQGKRKMELSVSTVCVRGCAGARKKRKSAWTLLSSRVRRTFLYNALTHLDLPRRVFAARSDAHVPARKCPRCHLVPLIMESLQPRCWCSDFHRSNFPK